MWAMRACFSPTRSKRGQRPSRALRLQISCSLHRWTVTKGRHTKDKTNLTAQHRRRREPFAEFYFQNLNMAHISAVLLLCLTLLPNRIESASEICSGPRCLSNQDWSAAQGRTDTRAAASRPQLHLSTQSRQGQAYANFYHQDARYGHHQTNGHHHNRGFAQPTGPDGTRRTNPRTITAEVFHPGCAGGTCPTAVNRRPTTDDRDASRECKGNECSRQKPKPCLGCNAQRGEDAGGNSSPVHVRDRAAQFAQERSDGGAWIQLTCDMKSGSNDVPSNDAIILQLQLSKDQEKVVEALKSQREEVREMHRLFSEQQEELLHQQREILAQQRKMHDYMEQVKAQYNILLDTVKQMSMQNLQEELDSQREVSSEPGGPHGLQQALSLHKVDMEASVMEVGHSLVTCGRCGPEEYCDFSGGHPRCEKCTVCPAGFFLVAQCSVHADRICQDRDECLELADLCEDQHKCVNTPGGFRCQGMTERDARTGMCGHDYFYNLDMDECQACAECEGQPAASRCTFTTDTVCSGYLAGESFLSLSWTGDVSLPDTRGHAMSLASPGVQLRIRAGDRTNLASAEDGHLVMKKHGLVWLEQSLSVNHGCRSFVQVCFHVNASDGSESRDLSGVRIEQREARAFQGVSISAVAEVAPGHVISTSLWSANQHCNRSDENLWLFEPSAASLSFMWLSHDTGAVAMTAQAALSAHYHTNHRPIFRITSTSDPYVVVPTHDGRGIRFAESGTVRFVFQQALYSMGQACVSEGFQMLAYLNRNGSVLELCRTFKPGVHYRDTSISLSGATEVGSGDTLAFEILSPAQCNVRFFSDDAGVSGLSLVWVPAAISASIYVSVAQTPSGAVRNKPLFFHQKSPRVSQMGLSEKGAAKPSQDLLFRESGTANVALDLKLIHSCSLLKVTLLQLNDPGAGWEAKGARPTPLAQHVGGQMPDGSQWASVSLRASFQVHNGTTVFFTLDCVRGRVNQVSPHAGSGVSVLWVSA
ncbi:uncharacterized protein LOC109520550 isoform X2 [Hippocampus comes]|uniref:uncharacterized protein LOC109520550 isoform X2 n=1 Tax=Hippocampus comes TaxID=109280 RepID=UPI00094F2D25|nr:PREDICTED: uncharacterized protein LOC109520550 isoform X2 [Hippocampus comes]